MTIMNFLSRLISIGEVWKVDLFSTLFLFIEGIIYEIVSYVYKMFTLITQLNFNSIYAIVGPVVEKVEAVIMVLLVFKLGMALIGMLLNPEGAMKQGKEILINIMVTVALLISYSFVFSLLNEIGMLVIGAPPGYNFQIISSITGESIKADGGLINRFVFGKEGNMDDISDMGEYMAYQVASVFIVNQTDENTLEEAIKEDGGGYNFMNLANLSSEVDRKVSYFPLMGALVGGYLIYVFAKICIEVGIRMFKLLVLQLIAPLAIVTILTEGVSSKGFKGTMEKFISTYMGVFTEVFVRVLFTLIITVFVSKFILNIGDFLGEAVAGGDDLFTKGLLLVIVIFAGYKFVLEIPNLLKSVFGGKLSFSGSGDFTGFVGGALGLGTGLATGVAAGYKSGENGWNRATGAIAGGLTGMTTGAWTGATKGNKIADKFKNVQTIKDSSTKRGENWAARGGFNNVVVGAGNDIIGRTKRQDKDMNRYQGQIEAVDAYDKANTEYNDAVNKAQVDAIKGTAMDGSTLLDMRGYGDEAGTTVQRTADQIYSEGYDNVLLGDNAENYAQRIISYDKEYQAAQADLITAQNSGDKQQIADAHAKLVSTKQYSEKRAKDYWNSKKEAATISVDNSKLVEAQSAANKKLGREETASIDVKATKREIAQKQKDIQDTRGYKATHPSSKK